MVNTLREYEIVGVNKHCEGNVVILDRFRTYGNDGVNIRLDRLSGVYPQYYVFVRLA